MTHERRTRATISILTLLNSTVSLHGENSWAAPATVTRNCSGCHGIDGNAELRYFPRIAGLDPAYAEKKLAEFKESPSPTVDQIFSLIAASFGRSKATGNFTPAERTNMIGMAHAVKPELMKQAVQWYAKQSPSPGDGRNDAQTQQGKEIFEKGVPDQQVLACASCHGQAAQGTASAPRLAGQNAEYVEAQMDKFRKGDLKHAPEMTMVAKEVNAVQARAVAAYLQCK
jgi:cytochrome c553